MSYAMLAGLGNRPLPLWAGALFNPDFEVAAIRSARRTMGDACPEIAPYPNLAYPGRCTNIPTDQQGGGSSASGGSSVAIDPAIVAANAAARFGLQLTEERAIQEKLAAEAIGEAAKLGIPLTCEVIANVSPASGGLPASTLYQAICGSDRQSAAQLIRSYGTVVQTTPINTGAGAGSGGGFNLTKSSTGSGSGSGGGSQGGGAGAGTGAGTGAGAGGGFMESSVLLPGGFELSMPLALGAGLLAFAFFSGGKR